MILHPPHQEQLHLATFHEYNFQILIFHLLISKLRNHVFFHWGTLPHRHFHLQTCKFLFHSFHCFSTLHCIHLHYYRSLFRTPLVFHLWNFLRISSHLRVSIHPNHEYNHLWTLLCSNFHQHTWLSRSLVFCSLPTLLHRFFHLFPLLIHELCFSRTDLLLSLHSAYIIFPLPRTYHFWKGHCTKLRLEDLMSIFKNPIHFSILWKSNLYRRVLHLWDVGKLFC